MLQSEASLRRRLQHRVSRLEALGLREGGRQASAIDSSGSCSLKASPRQRVVLLERYRDQLEEEFLQYQGEITRLQDDKVLVLRENMTLKGRLQMLQVLTSNTRQSSSPTPVPSNFTRSISSSPPPIPSPPHLPPTESPGESTRDVGKSGHCAAPGAHVSANYSPQDSPGGLGGRHGRTPRLDQLGMSTITR